MPVRTIGVAVAAILVSLGRAEAETPAQRAKLLVDAQLASLTDSSKPKLESMFDPEAVILGIGRGQQLKELSIALDQALAGGSPHSVIKKTKIGSLVAGGTDSAVWWTAEVTITIRSVEPGFGGPKTSSHTMRMTELAVADGATWKIVAATFDEPRSPNASVTRPSSVEGATAAGPLAALPSSPMAIKAALSNHPGVVVIGTDKGERGVGPKAAAKLLDRWAKLKLEMDTQVREVRTKTWGYVQGNVAMIKGEHRYEMTVLLIAFPLTDGTWRVGAVHYSSQ